MIAFKVLTIPDPKAFDEAASTTGKPTAILAKTFKGYKFPNISDMLDWHGKPLGDKAEEVISAIQDQMDIETSGLTPKIQEPIEDAPEVDINDVRLSTSPAYKLGEMVATRLAYGTALAKLAEYNPRVIGLDGDTKNSTYSDKIKKVISDSYSYCHSNIYSFYLSVCITSQIKGFGGSIHRVFHCRTKSCWCSYWCWLPQSNHSICFNVRRFLHSRIRSASHGSHFPG